MVLLSWIIHQQSAVHGEKERTRLNGGGVSQMTSRRGVWGKGERTFPEC